MEAIAKTCDHVLNRDDPALNSSEHIEALDRLERRLIHAKQHITQQDNMEPSRLDEAIKVAELYRLAALVYLYRAGKRYPSTNSKVRAVTETGLRIVGRLRTCGRAFPLVIIGCQARCDEDRLAILGIFRRTLSCREISTEVGTQRFIEASWGQDDLHTGEELDYVEKLNAIMNLGKCRPCFAASLVGYDPAHQPL